MSSNKYQNILTAAVCCLSLAGCGGYAEAGAGANTAFYVLIDNAGGAMSKQKTPETMTRAHKLIEAFKFKLSRTNYREATIEFIGSQRGETMFSSKPAQLTGITQAEYDAKVAPGPYCGDFKIWFDKLHLRMRQDKADSIYIIISSPMIDVKKAYCIKGADEHPVLPQAPSDSYELETLLQNPAVKRVLIVGTHTQQEQVWFEHFESMENIVMPEFITADNIIDTIARLHK